MKRRLQAGTTGIAVDPCRCAPVQDLGTFVGIAKMQYYRRMAWIVEVLDARVRDELEVLPADMKARFRRIVELIQGHGLERMREPHVKHLEGPLWEMRMKGKDGIS